MKNKLIDLTEAFKSASISVQKLGEALRKPHKRKQND